MEFDEQSHFSHPQHKLLYANTKLLFVCEGCRRVGIGSRFNCSLCNFEFHTHCTTTPIFASLRHDFYPKCQFKFHHCPPGDSTRCCNACGQDVNGFVYHCRKYGYNLHPCCATLPHVINVGDGLRLHLHHKASAPCHRCKRIGKSWSYRSNCKTYNWHIACMTEMWLDKRDELYYDGDGSSSEVAMVLRNRLPITGAAGNNHHRSWKEKVKKSIKLAAMVVHFIIAAVFGDPAHMITAVYSSLQS